MTTRTSDGFNRWQIAAKVAPFGIIALAGMAVRTPLAASYPFVALVLSLWIVSDTLMLALLARSSGKPECRAVLGVLAGASFTVWLGLPSPVRGVLLETPALALMMVVVVVGHVAWAMARASRVLSRLSSDRREQWVSAISEIFPPALVRLAAAELTVIHMALFRWGGPADVPTNAHAFAYHKHLTPMCVMLLVLSAIEIAVYHLLIGHWSHIASVVMFILSDVGFVYLVGVIKSFRFRPVLLTPEGVRVRAGFLIDQLVPLDAIVAIESNFTGEEVRASATLNAALLAWPNIMLRLDRPLPRRSFLKKREPFNRIAFRLDDPEPFIRLLIWRLGHRTN
ncbi:hypothetical protein HL653_03475 [Sphingomonas sp. AP4-R1]|uniref:hypothetical protein n=1 Tax=Sphingomonas sp. AP4-R1 TaxID=2735134 RepID=UPI001493D23C|nr:hypothetical protein [Sphingomonas sp. AP4-R1]QJU56970.1 hypothetical protein HL653_03475 [Sphingomonas sp. AP4-R1]